MHFSRMTEMKGRYTEASRTPRPIPSGTRRPDLVDRSPVTNEENAWILPLRGNAPNPSALHELVLQPRPASHTMSEDSQLCGHPEITPTDPLCHARVMLNHRRCPGISTLEEEKSRLWCVVASVWPKTRRVPRHKSGARRRRSAAMGEWIFLARIASSSAVRLPYLSLACDPTCSLHVRWCVFVAGWLFGFYLFLTHFAV